MESVAHCRSALKRHPLGHPNRSTSLDNLANALKARFDHTGQMADLEEAVIHHRSGLELRPPGHPNRVVSLNNLAAALQDRFDHRGQMADLEEAAVHLRGALELCPLGHPNRSGLLMNLAAALGVRFEHTGQMTDLEEAIVHLRCALELCPLGHPSRSGPLINLANALKIRSDHTGQMADLEEAVVHYRGALELCPLGHPNRSSSLNNLAAALHARFDHTGQMADVEEAVVHYRGALKLCPLGHPSRFNSLGNLANALKARFDHTGRMPDLEEAIVHLRCALELCPLGHPNRSSPLISLATALGVRFATTGQMADLEEAVVHLRCALELCPLGHPNRSSPLISLATALGVRFDHTGQMADSEEAVVHLRGALKLCPLGHPNRSTSLSNLANTLKARFDHMGQMADLEEAVVNLRGALKLYPLGHPNRSNSLGNLANVLRTRFDRLACNEDLHEAVGLMQFGTDDTFDTPAHRYTCVSQLISILTAYKQPGVLEAYAAALNLLQLSLAVYPDVELRREALGTHRLSPSLAMNAAAHAIDRGLLKQTIELLEQGRGMLWSNIRGYRHPIEEVRQVDPELAERFRTTSVQLEALATSSQLGSIQLSGKSPNELRAVSDARWARQRQLSLERDNIIQQIRQLGSGLEHFLTAVPFNVLQAAACEGPVIIINVAEWRSDAIILRHREAPILLPLSVDGQDREAVYRTIKDLSEVFFVKRGNPGFSAVLESTILKTLAEILVIPVMETLESLDVRKNARIWWCPTSALCALPIHAAGLLPIKYVSSYTPTLSALISARAVVNKQSPALGNSSDSTPSLLAIIHRGHPPKTKGDPAQLRTVLMECKVIEKAAEKAGGPGRVRSLVEANATREAVLGQLPNHSWVHFACHGHLNTSRPFQSAFELENDPLSLSDLVKARLPNADFAFLAVCDSATAGSTSVTPDEALHLAAAVQFCGVRSVVGTLWPMADEDGPRVAQVFYRYMFQENDSRKSAEALQKVVSAIRRKVGPWGKAEANNEGESLSRWANYIHIGA
ncbi:hypothetical protein FIBSPDRAFT_773488 [Athelia psychrophila]|uniref:CHAT domain-containing protein n=1 Tax=Athelia psychrophila TaxID=1759441 RepID=A0A166WF66_9AGAM|nr:hypothetical protein FIBSPDRAFT_773488 [Fibularhizoctonia sp. CBS 109695]